MSINPLKIIVMALSTALLLYSAISYFQDQNAMPLLAVAVIIYLLTLGYNPDES